MSEILINEQEHSIIRSINTKFESIINNRFQEIFKSDLVSQRLDELVLMEDIKNEACLCKYEFLDYLKSYKLGENDLSHILKVLYDFIDKHIDKFIKNNL